MAVKEGVPRSVRRSQRAVQRSRNRPPRRVRAAPFSMLDRIDRKRGRTVPYRAKPVRQLQRQAAAGRRARRQFKRGIPVKTGGRKYQAKTAGGGVRLVTRREYLAAMREFERDYRAKTLEARRRGYASAGAYALAHRARPAQRGAADLKIAGLNLDRITGRGGRAALDVLDQLSRPVHGVAGGTRAAMRGENVARAISRGLSNQDKYLFSDVLKQAGVRNKLIRGTVGFGLDIVADPTTYFTFGAGPIAKSGAKGLKVAFAGKKAQTGIRLPELSAKSRERLGKVFPVRPADMTEAEWRTLNRAARRRRGTILAEMGRSSRRATAVRKALGGSQRRLLPEAPVAGARRRIMPRRRGAPIAASQRVRDAIESQDFRGLTPNERMAAQAVIEENERLLGLRRAAGERAARYTPDLTKGEPPGYVYRQAARYVDNPRLRKRLEKEQELVEQAARPPRRTQRMPTTTMENFMRGDRRPMSVVRAEEPGKFIEDIPTTMLAKAQHDIGRAANERFRRDVMQMGRKLDPDAPPPRVDEAVYKNEKGRLVEVKNKNFKEGDPSDFVILKRSIAERAMEAQAGRARVPILDPVTNKLKWVLTIPNPQYWTRNYYGGLFNAYAEGIPGHKLPRAIADAHRVAARMGHKAQVEETLGRQPRNPGKFKLGREDPPVSVDDLIGELERANVSGGGVTSELLGAETRRRPKMQMFEDVPRLAAYIHYRRMGRTPDEAAERAMASQFDYGARTKTEMNWASKIFPFYTWRSRNVALQTQTLLQRPGKLAAVQKAREELGRELPPNWESKLTEAEALGVPIPIPGTKQLLYPSLPITDLNFLTGDVGALSQQMLGSLNPVFKIPIEFFTGYNFYFRDRIEREGSKWFSAPDTLIEALPSPLRDRLIADGVIRMGRDSWTNERTWQWRGKADYITKTTPITSTILQAGTSGRSRRGQKSEQRILGWLTGLRTAPYEPKMNALYKLYEDRAKVEEKIADLQELKVTKRRNGSYTREYADLLKRQRELRVKAYELSGKLGDKQRGERPPGAKGKKKGGGGNIFGGGSSGGRSSGGGNIFGG